MYIKNIVAGRPTASMVLILAGCVVNIILNTVFVVFFGWGMKGAATATIIGQAVGAVLILWFIFHTKVRKLRISPGTNYV